MNKEECCHIEEKLSLRPLYLLLIVIGSVSMSLSFLFPIHSFMMYLMGVWFLAFGLLKLYDLRGFVEAFCKYDFIARRWKSYGYLFPFLEIAIGLIYIFNTSMLYMTIVNMVAFIISLLGIASAYSVIKSGEKIACACMWIKWKLPMTKITVLENFFMAFMIVYMFVYPASLFISGNRDHIMREHCKTMPEMSGCEKYR